MDLLDYLKKDRIHHANLIVGEPATSLVLLRKRFSDQFGEAFVDTINPDFLCWDLDLFGIEESRKLKEEQSRRAIGKQGKYFIISFNNITIEAQNALLKTFEEPAQQTFFFVLLKKVDGLIPTLISRCEILKHADSSSDNSLEQMAEKFLKKGISERFKLIKILLAQKIKPTEFIDNLIKLLKVELREERLRAEDKKILMLLTKAYDNASRQSSLPSMILEHLALVIPPNMLK